MSAEKVRPPIVFKVSFGLMVMAVVLNLAQLVLAVLHAAK